MTKMILKIIILMQVLCYLCIGQEIRLGFITDYQSFENLPELVKLLEKEIQKTVGQANEVVLSADNIVFSGSTLQEATQNYSDLSSRSDVVIAFGPITTRAITVTGDLSVPTIAVGIIDRDIQDLPLTPDGTSGVRNFSYILTATDLDEIMMSFFEITPFKNLTMLVEKVPGDIFNDVKANEKINNIKLQYDVTIEFLELGDSVSEDLAKISEKTDAVLLSMQLTPVKRIKEIATFLIDKKLPSFSRSKWHVESGIFASRSMDNSAIQIMRKIAIMVDDLYDQQPLADMSVYLRNKEELYINMSTANKIGVYPDFKFLLTANLLKDKDESAKVYSLSEIINYALEANLDIQFSGKDLELSDQDINFAQSSWYPTINLQGQGTQINKESAGLGQAEKTLTGKATLQQVIFSEEVLANIKIQKYLYNAQKYSLEQDILDVLADTYVGYFNLLAAKSRLAIEFDNFNVSKRNIELAKVKVRLGSANNSDVFRWESELALAQQGVVDAQTTLLTFKLQLNVLLGNVLEQDFDVEDVKIDDEVYNYFKQGDLNDMVSNPADVEVLSDFLVIEAVASHPAKKEFLENINAVQRQHTFNKRAFYLPTFALQGEFSRVFRRAGKGSEPPDLGQDLGGGLNDNTWFIGVGISYPLFDGSRRFVKKQQTQLQLEQLEIGRLNLDQNLEIGVRTTILKLLSANTNMEFSQVAADNSMKSFELVQDNYSQGMVSIVSLIDAQRAALQAKLGYDIATYDFLIAHLQLEYSIGLFSMLANPDDIEDLKQRFFQYKNENR